MSIIRPHDGDVTCSVTSTTPDGDAGNATVLMNDAEAVRFKVTAVNGLTVKVEVQASKDADWKVHESWQIAPATPSYTKRAADVTITLADEDYILVSAPGMYAVRLKRQAGTSASIVGRAFDGMDAFLLERLVASGITVDITEFPAAAALTDNFANPTTTQVAAMGMVWDGSNWDRAPGNSTNGSKVYIDQTTPGTTNAVQPQPNVREVTITFSLDTSAYTANDVLADSQILNSVVRANDAKGYLVGFQLLDEDDNTAAGMNVFLLSANVSLGSENSAISITDANARNIISVIPIAASDWVDIINSKVVTFGAGKNPLPIAITPVSGTDDIYIALQTLGTPTQTASGITGRFWFQDAN